MSEIPEKYLRYAHYICLRFVLVRPEIYLKQILSYSEKPKNILAPKKIMGPKNFWIWRNFRSTKSFWSKKPLGPEKFCIGKKFCVRKKNWVRTLFLKNFYPQKLLVKNILAWKNLGSHKILCPMKLLVQKLWAGLKNSLGLKKKISQKKFKSKIFDLKKFGQKHFGPKN